MFERSEIAYWFRKSTYQYTWAVPMPHNLHFDQFQVPENGRIEVTDPAATTIPMYIDP